MRDSEGKFVKGVRANYRYWDEDKIKSEMTKQVISIYKQTGVVVQPTHFRSINSKLFSAFRRHIGSPANFYNQILIENDLPLPDSYYKDNVFFRGFYEFIGYCLIKSWGIKIQPTPILNRENGYYVSDGLLTDINVYWEHWGQLNKNNTDKMKYYQDNNLKIIHTYDSECQKSGNGISYLYEQLKNNLKGYGYDNIPNYSFDYVISVIKNDVYDFQIVIDNLVKIIQKNKWDKHIAERELRESDEGYRVISIINKFFNGSILNLKKYLNDTYGFNYVVTAKRGSYKNIDHLINIITPIIKELGYVPTQEYFAEIRRNDIPVMVSRFCGGLNNLRRNEIEEGEFYYIVKNVLGDVAPYDRQLVWKDNQFHNNTVNILKYYKDKGLPFPKVLNYLKNNEEYLPFGPALHSQITPKQCGGWDGFFKKYNY